MSVSTSSVLQQKILIAATERLEIPIIWTLDLDMIWESDDPGNNGIMSEEEIEAWMQENGYDSIKMHLYPSDGKHLQDVYRLTGSFADITGYVNTWYDAEDPDPGKHGSYYLDDIEVWTGN